MGPGLVFAGGWQNQRCIASKNLVIGSMKNGVVCGGDLNESSNFVIFVLM